MSHRSKPFSGKKKKQQLIEKRLKKALRDQDGNEETIKNKVQAHVDSSDGENSSSEGEKDHGAKNTSEEAVKLPKNAKSTGKVSPSFKYELLSNILYKEADSYLFLFSSISPLIISL